MNEPTPEAPIRWGQSIATHGTGDTTTVDIDVFLPGNTEVLPMEIPLADATTLHSMLGDAIREHTADRSTPNIPAAVAAHVLWCLFGRDPNGYPPSAFTTRLLALWEYADDENAARLSRAYPAYGAAIDLLRVRGGLDCLRTIAAT
ncbi:hypothetical protein [Streptantibioticus silvisoli]|uniref:Uncharacterized protein n=1 Tax=Streptantibioticus silvisoli TaxID=2705255 RepID=A0ABT6W4Z0_9ACTN|nr:hypothetical protein [Streptantibioticus silvisoli]MDI5965810.1 hypothetical protein [Streptantibioticus silvisoli]